MLILVICIALPMITLAQGPPDPEDTPIDGGLTLLLAAGAAYGVKKYRDGKKVKNNEEPDVKQGEEEVKVEVEVEGEEEVEEQRGISLSNQSVVTRRSGQRSKF